MTTPKPLLTIAQFNTFNDLGFYDLALLRQALTHRSYINEHPQDSDNERLEFLGDAVLDLIAADLLYRRYDQQPEGELTRLRAAIVRRESLAEFARQCRIDEVLRLGKGDMSRGGRANESNLEGAFESVLGALYLERGQEAVRVFVTPFLERRLAALDQGLVSLDARTRLQEWSQGHFTITPQYHHVATDGPEHLKTFTVEVWIGARQVGVGQATNKQEASRLAAEMALAADLPALLSPDATTAAASAVQPGMARADQDEQ